MINVHSPVLLLFLKLYVAVVLAIATIFSPIALSFAPILLLIGYLYLWRWPISAVVSLLTEYFLFFAVALLLTPVVEPLFSPLLSLPILLLINHRLKETASLLSYQDSRYLRRPTSICLALLIIAIGVLGVAWLLSSLSLLLAGVIIIVYLATLGAIIWRRLPLKPVAETQIQQRMVAGAEAHLQIKLTTKSKIGGSLFVESPYQWLKVNPDRLSLKEKEPAIKVSLSPALSGPSIVKLKGQAIDPWGLIQTSFELEPIRLHVIPRARYAAWLAKKYLAETKPGGLPLMSSVASIKPMYGLRRGNEYYGSQLYQPGDSLKNIDWKHSMKYNELISKEFTEFQGQTAIILINLVAGNAEEADKLAHRIIVTALSLAQENIPAALAVYHHEGVKLTTPTLQPRQLVLESLKISGEIVTLVNPVKYLNPPDVTKIRANISRLRFTESNASRVLSRLLQLEYENLDNNARLNPATQALSEVLTKADKQSTIVIISGRNHDAEAIAFNTFSLTRKGNTVITV